MLESTLEFGHTFYHYDGRGNVVQLTHEAGAMVAKYAKSSSQKEFTDVRSR